MSKESALKNQLFLEFKNRITENPDLPNLQRNCINYYHKIGLSKEGIKEVLDLLVEKHGFYYE